MFIDRHPLTQEFHVQFADQQINDQVSLHFCEAKWQLISRAFNQTKPFSIDFLSGRSAYRQKMTSIKQESLAKAVGLKKGFRPEVIDATAGLGRDAFLLAGFGCSVVMLERSPALALLLLDALYRYKTSALKDCQLMCVYTDAKTYLGKLPNAQRPDVIYLDPMYPESKQKSLVKQSMRLVRTLVGNDADASALLQLALTCAKNRVVVKRPKRAAYLALQAPDFSIKSQQHRFDVYLTKS